MDLKETKKKKKEKWKGKAKSCVWDRFVCNGERHTHTQERRAWMVDELESCDGKMFIFVIYFLHFCVSSVETEQIRAES